MANIILEDLIENTDLDTQAMTALRGGVYSSGFGWLATPLKSSAARLPILNQYFTFNQYVADNIQIINQTQNVNLIDSDNSQVSVDGNANNGLSLPQPVFL